MLRDDNASWWNPKVLTIFALIFVCGTAFGSAMTRVFLHSRLDVPKRMVLNLTQLKAELDLSPEQARTVTKELDDYAKYYQNIEEQRADVADHGKRRIFSVLTPEQQKKFNLIFSQLPH